jgi:peroxiredoxin
VLDDVKATYAKLTAVDLAGTTTFDSDIAGKQGAENDTFASSFQAPNKFHHEMKGDMITGSTGEKAYALSLQDNGYILIDAPKDRVAPNEAPRAIWDVLTMQNPSLAMVLSRDAATQLIDGATTFAVINSKDFSSSEIEKGTEVKKIADVKLADKSYTALQLTNAGGDFTFLIDPQSHLLRQITIDQKRFLQHVGQPDVKKAVVTIDYATINLDPPHKNDQFAWTPPANAHELTAVAAADDGASPGSALVGKPAPDFRLPTPDGKEFALADQRGSVVVVDFWATWCGPCVKSLPHLNKLYEDKKDAGLKVFAISVDQEKDKVPPFIAAKKLTLTVLLDNDEQKAAEKYGVQGIPQTVVIGKDGTVKKVFVGFGPGSEDQLRKVVEEAMK